MLNYLKYRLACDIMFGVFMVVWVLSRHLGYLAVCYSIFADYLRIVRFGCYTGSNTQLRGPFEPPMSLKYLITPFLNPEGLICQTKLTTTLFVFELLFLQVIMLVWFGMIVKVAWKVVRGRGAEDSRSEDEEEVDEIDREKGASTKGDRNCEYIEVPPLEEEVGVEAINLSGRRSSPAKRYKKSVGTSSGVTLPHDKKELLGRIGCDKGS